MFIINLKILLASLLDYIEDKKIISTVALFFLGMIFYLPYFISIAYLPTLNEVSVFFIIFLLVIPIFFLLFIPIVIMIPAYIWDNLIKKDAEFASALFKINNQNIENVFAYIILPLFSVVMIITSSFLKSYYVTILFSAIFLGVVIRVCVSLDNLQYFKKYFVTLSASAFFLFLVIISFLIGVEERLHHLPSIVKFHQYYYMVYGYLFMLHLL